MTDKMWIVVADGARGRVLEHAAGDHEFPSALPMSFVDSRLPTRLRVSDRSGQTLERVGAGGHAKHKAVDARAHDRQVLAKRIAEAVRHGRTDNRFDSLVLVAPPAFLGLLRAALDGATRKLVVADHTKDISALSPHRLTQRLRSLIESTDRRRTA